MYRLSIYHRFIFSKRLVKVAKSQVEQALRLVLNLTFYNFNCSERLLKSHHVFFVPVVAACSQLLLKSVSKLFENLEWSNSLLRHFKIQTLLKINCCLAAISYSAFGVTQYSQIFFTFLQKSNSVHCALSITVCFLEFGRVSSQ